MHAVTTPEMTDHLVPTSFGAFKPVGWLLVGLPTQVLVDALAASLAGAGWPDIALQRFAPSESLPELEAMAEQAGTLAGFGFEITLLRRYVVLAREGYRWLLVKVDDSEQAAAAAELARGCGATVAVHYRTLTVEELI